MEKNGKWREKWGETKFGFADDKKIRQFFMLIKERLFLCPQLGQLTPIEADVFFTGCLSSTEQKKASLINDHVKRNVYIQAHGFKRFILGKFLGIEPFSIEFYTDTFGKPFILQERGESRIFFNLSHTLGMTALILSDETIAGIDVERIVFRDDISSLEHIVYHEVELMEAEKITDEIERVKNFYSKWVIKESILKAVGTGLSTDPKSLLVFKDEKGTCRLQSASIKNAHFFDINYWQYLNYAIAYSTDNYRNQKKDAEISIYHYTHGSFTEII